eukprot:CAMPEP_0196654684 /NCGR_PEP_ID=MMETSP1086-20130531/4412_1 /TAXON_ID=77921 /ORGANISM="Cyanoptyche  gloeocystis , Strain SAG4.97" /LENGTH=59 /DNA_ID=CAMNT_0041986589 /DNA_START=218 /DNA_END=397 /DNA_ORIENTATION=+
MEMAAEMKLWAALLTLHREQDRSDDKEAARKNGDGGTDEGGGGARAFSGPYEGPSDCST